VSVASSPPHATAQLDLTSEALRGARWLAVSHSG
jgi:hypothetical protein